MGFGLDPRLLTRRGDVLVWTATTALRLKFQERWAPAFQVVQLLADLPLWSEHSADPGRPIPFRVDTGAEVSVIPLALAEQDGWPVPPPETAIRRRVTTAVGPDFVLVRPGRVRVWWTRNRIGHPFDWPVLFRPDLSPTVPPLLGLGGVVTTCRWAFDGRPTAAAPFGGLAVDDTR